MSAPVEISLDNLAHLPVWVGWREEQRDGDPTKMPFDPRTGRKAKTDNSANWATRGEAETWAVIHRGGVGIVLSQLNGGDCNLCGIDLDTCRDPITKIIQDWAREVIDRFRTYTEVSPSGTGAKIYFTHARADLPAIERLFDGKGGRQFKNGGGKHCPAIEVYRTRRYFAVTDESIGPTDFLRQVSLADLEWLLLDAGPKFAHKESQKSKSGNDQSRSGKAFRKGAALKTAGLSYDAMRDALLVDTDPEIAEWARTKGLAIGERELHRIYENAGDADALAGKKRVAALLPDAETGPVMELLENVLSMVDAAEPPMRDASGWPVEIQCRETAGLHELSSDYANDEADENSRLPPPKNLLLTKHDRESLEILIGDYVSFIRKTKKDERAVAPPAKFVTHYLKYRRSKLPRVHAALTMPLVLPDGTLLARNGLDRERRAVFRIDPALLSFVPKAEDCTESAVDEAFKFLADEWLCDVATDLEGKCVLIGLALTIIERVLLPARPLFFVTAGLRGGGKTTVLMMIALSVTGTKAAAAAWTADPAERKKALFAYLLEALPFLVWDNIPRGTMIACPHLERASTAETYSDRVLGETKTLIAPAYTIHGFTGNNIGPKSDQASRSLEARLSTDRPDPENREFKHQDPIGWTQDHRGQILRALYTILLGNPQLKRRRPPETRFKEWWHLVGSAVENASGQPISFKQMFAHTEAKDEEAVEQADVIQALHAIYGGNEFTAISLHGHLAKSAKDAEFGILEEPGTAELRQFCTTRLARTPSPKSISHNLQAISDAPAKVLCGTARLRTYVNTNTKQRRFWVEVKRDSKNG